MNKKRFVIGVLAVVTLALLFLVLIQWTRQDITLYTVKEKTTQRQKLQEEDIVSMSLAKSDYKENMIRNKDEILDLYLKLGHTLYPGQVIVRDSLEALEDSDQKEFLLLNEGQKLFSLKADLLLSAGSSFQVGQYLDVIYMDKKQNQPAATLIHNVRIVGLKDRKGEDIEKSGIASILLLAMDEASTHALVTAQQRGTIALVGTLPLSGEGECILFDVSF